MLQIENLEFRYQYRRILQKLSFRVAAGEILHITGPNGSGKTTLMSLLAGLRHPQGGTIELRSEDGRVLADRREWIEYLPAEANALYGKMDAIQNLSLWRRLRGLPCDEALLRQELARWDLDHPLLRQGFPVERFSTGMKRRLALARIHLAQTPVWLLDEPLYGLDTKGIQTFQTILRQHLQNRGMVLIVSHDTAPLADFPVKTLALSQETSS